MTSPAINSLLVKTGRRTGRRFPLPAGELLVGRGEDCVLQLDSQRVSRRHCRLRTAPEGVYVEDLGSRNGTYVNDIPVDRPTLLELGDELRIGPVVFQAAFTQPAPSAAPAAAGPSATPTWSDSQIVNWLGRLDAATPPETADFPIPADLPPPPPRDEVSSVTLRPRRPLRRS